MILATSRGVRVYAYPEAVDLRKGYDGLFGLVKQGLRRDPLSGELYLFVNKRRDSCKVLVWDGTGLWILTKRLEKGAFSWPKNLAEGQTKLSLAPQALAMLTDGVDLRGAQLRPWYERES